VGAVLSAAPSRITIVPAAALAREAEAPLIVTLLAGTVVVTLYCKVDAVAPFAVIHSEYKDTICISPV